MARRAPSARRPPPSWRRYSRPRCGRNRDVSRRHSSSNAAASPEGTRQQLGWGGAPGEGLLPVLEDMGVLLTFVHVDVVLPLLLVTRAVVPGPLHDVGPLPDVVADGHLFQAAVRVPHRSPCLTDLGAHSPRGIDLSIPSASPLGHPDSCLQCFSHPALPPLPGCQTQCYKEGRMDSPLPALPISSQGPLARFNDSQEHNVLLELQLTVKPKCCGWPPTKPPNEAHPLTAKPAASSLPHQVLNASLRSPGRLWAHRPGWSKR